MSATTAARRGQSAAARTMTDLCTITRAASGGPMFDPATGQYVTPEPAMLYAGKCRVKPRGTEDRVVQAGEQAVSLWPFVVSVPLSVLAELDDVVTVTASADPSLVERKFRVRAAARGTAITARRLECEVVEA